MNTPCRIVETQQLLQAYEEILPHVESLPLRISGNSMAPFLRDGRDTVYLCAIRAPLRVGDMVLYRRKNGQYILHRICRAEGGDRYTMIGDGQYTREPGIHRTQILATVCRVERKGHIQKPGCLCWEFFARIWVRMVPLRPACQHGYLSMKNWLHRS